MPARDERDDVVARLELGRAVHLGREVAHRSARHADDDLIVRVAMEPSLHREGDVGEDPRALRRSKRFGHRPRWLGRPTRTSSSTWGCRPSERSTRRLVTHRPGGSLPAQAWPLLLVLVILTSSKRFADSSDPRRMVRVYACRVARVKRESASDAPRRHGAGVVAAEQAITDARDEIVDRVSQRRRDERSGSGERGPRHRPVARSTIAAAERVNGRPDGVDPDHRVDVGELRMARKESRRRFAGERGKSRRLRAIPFQNERHRAVAERAHAVIEEQGDPCGAFTIRSIRRLRGTASTEDRPPTAAGSSLRGASDPNTGPNPAGRSDRRKAARARSVGVPPGTDLRQGAKGSARRRAAASKRNAASRGIRRGRHRGEPDLPVEPVVVGRDHAGRPRPDRRARIGRRTPARRFARRARIGRSLEDDLAAFSADRAECAVGVHQVHRAEGRVHALLAGEQVLTTGIESQATIAKSHAQTTVRACRCRGGASRNLCAAWVSARSAQREKRREGAATRRRRRSRRAPARSSAS